MADNTDLLRPEARPIPYWKHHKRARQALGFIIRVLKDGVARASESKHIEGESIDPNRASRIVFISGEPGSGKSSLYLTLKAMVSNTKYAEGCKELAESNNLQKILWLDPLDLEVAGEEGENLLAAVLVRLFRKLEEKSVHSSQCEDAIKKLEDLATDIGIAWEGNLEARAAALDPDTFSTEVMRTQRARLRVNERLKEALDNLAQHDCYGCSSETLFLLPVDDFYLKPAASLHLLRLLRMISIPRLFFLVMGDIDTVEALFIEKSLGDWTSVAGTRLFAAKTDRLDDAITRARELRARYLRKLLPPGQRSELQPMDWHEALDLEFGRIDPETTGTTIERILADTNLDNPLGKEDLPDSTLLKFLISPHFPYLNSEGGIGDEEAYEREREEREQRAKGQSNAPVESTEQLELKKNRSAYTALQILDATPREIMDFGALITEVSRERRDLLGSAPLNKEDLETPLLLLAVRDIVNLVRDENSFLDEEHQKELEGVLPTRHYSARDISFEMDRLCLRPAQSNWKSEDGSSLRLSFRNHRSWDLSPNRSKDGLRCDEVPNYLGDQKKVLNNRFDNLPPRPTAWFILLHDLAWTWSHESLKENLVKRLCRSLNGWKGKPAESDSADLQDYEGWAVLVESKVAHHLPIPEFETFLQLDQFLHVWSRGLVWLEKTGKLSSEKVAVLWVLAGSTILANCYWMFAPNSSNWYEKLFKLAESSTNLVHDLVKKFQTLRKEALPTNGLKETELQISSDVEGDINKWLGDGDWLKWFKDNARKRTSKADRSRARISKAAPLKGKS